MTYKEQMEKAIKECQEVGREPERNNVRKWKEQSL